MRRCERSQFPKRDVADYARDSLIFGRTFINSLALAALCAALFARMKYHFFPAGKLAGMSSGRQKAIC